MRIEYKGRGAPHAHLLIYLDKKTSNRLYEDDYAISAIIPDKETDPELYDLVKKFQIHECKEDICIIFRGKIIYRQGYPQPIVDRDIIHPTGSRWLYRREKAKDRWVIPYTRSLLKLRQCNMSAQLVTDKGILNYLIGYLVKVEQGYYIGDFDKNPNEVERYLNVRNVGIPEAIADTLGYSHYTTKPTIEYVNVSLPDERLKLLKSDQDLQYIIEHKNNLEKAGLLFDEELNNPFKHNSYKAYFNRPKEIEDLTFIAFRKGWKYSINFTLVPKRCKDILLPSPNSHIIDLFSSNSR